MARKWLKNHPDWSIGASYVGNHFQGWTCKRAGLARAMGSTMAEAVQMASWLLGTGRG